METKNVLFQIDSDIHERFKIFAIKQKLKVSNLATIALNEYLDRNKAAIDEANGGAVVRKEKKWLQVRDADCEFMPIASDGTVIDQKDAQEQRFQSVDADIPDKVEIFYAGKWRCFDVEDFEEVPV